MDTADTIVAMRVDIPANVRRTGFNAEPAPGPWSSSMVVNIAGGRYASGSRIIRWGHSVFESRKLMGWCLGWVNGACKACCDQPIRQAGGCRHAQVTRHTLPPGGRPPGRIATNLLTHTSIPPSRSRMTPIDGSTAVIRALLKHLVVERKPRSFGNL
jgi:hypothetical protein